MFKSEKGLTFMVLVITVLVLIIIGSAFATGAVSTYNESKVKIYVKEMDIIQEKINLYAEKERAGISGYDMTQDTFGLAIDSVNTKDALETIEYLEIENLLESGSVNSSGSGTTSEKYANYRYFSMATLNSVLGLENINRKVIVDIKSKKIYSVSPIVYEGKQYYSAELLRNKNKTK